MKVYIKSAILVNFLLVLIQSSVQAQQDEIYEPEKYICHEKCVCQNKTDSLILDCTKMKMMHVLNKWPPHPDHLIATFSWNNISELQQIPATEAKTISLSYSHCEIKSLQSALFIDATGIEYLDLSWNLLTGQEVRAEVFRGRYNNKEYEPIALQQLDLSHNQIESLSAKVFEHTPNLTRLNLNHNPLKVIDIQTATAISSVLKLSALNLANTSIKTFSDGMVSRLKQLRELDLSSNELKIVPEAVSFLGKSLEILKLGENPIEHFYDQSFIGLHALRELNISSMSDLKTIRHNTFSTLNELQMLNCSNNPRLYHINNEAFGNAKKPPLKELYLSGNNLKTLYQNQINWSNLSVLELSGNRWLCDCELYHTLIQVNKNHDDVISSAATCSLPLKYAGIELDDLDAISKACNESLHDISVLKVPGGPISVLLKVVSAIAIITLMLTVFFIFWKIMIKYKSVRSFNTMYPVMYVSAPTFER